MRLRFLHLSKLSCRGGNAAGPASPSNLVMTVFCHLCRGPGHLLLEAGTGEQWAWPPFSAVTAPPTSPFLLQASEQICCHLGVVSVSPRLQQDQVIGSAQCGVQSGARLAIRACLLSGDGVVSFRVKWTGSRIRAWLGAKSGCN